VARAVALTLLAESLLGYGLVGPNSGRAKIPAGRSPTRGGRLVDLGGHPHRRSGSRLDGHPGDDEHRQAGREPPMPSVLASLERASTGPDPSQTGTAFGPAASIESRTAGPMTSGFAIGANCRRRTLRGSDANEASSSVARGDNECWCSCLRCFRSCVCRILGRQSSGWCRGLRGVPIPASLARAMAWARSAT
jgi:hypothetical protein